MAQLLLDSPYTAQPPAHLQPPNSIPGWPWLSASPRAGFSLRSPGADHTLIGAGMFLSALQYSQNASETICALPRNPQNEKNVVPSSTSILSLDIDTHSQGRSHSRFHCVGQQNLRAPQLFRSKQPPLSSLRAAAHRLCSQPHPSHPSLKPPKHRGGGCSYVDGDYLTPPAGGLWFWESTTAPHELSLAAAQLHSSSLKGAFQNESFRQ